MKTRFSIKKAVSALLSVALVVSTLYIGTKPAAVSASDETNSETKTTTTVKEEVLAYNDYTSAASSTATKDAWESRRGNAVPATDPDDSSNTVIANVVPTGGDNGTIYVGDEFTSDVPTGYVTAEADKTYRITFKWKYVGEQKGGVTRIGVGLAEACPTVHEGKDESGNDIGSNRKLVKNETVVKTIEAGMYSQNEWNEATVNYTIDASWDLTANKYLALYTQNTNSAASSVYFDDIKVTILKKITETVLAENDYSDAKVYDLVGDGTVSEADKIWGALNAAMQYRGNSFATADPDDPDNVVVAHRTGHADRGTLFFGDDYKDITKAPADNIKVQSGGIYKISFQWKCKGTQEAGKTYFGIGLCGSAGKKIEDVINEDSLVTVATIEQGEEYDDAEWRNATVCFTVGDGMDIEKYPNLVLYTRNTNTTSCVLYFDNIKVTAVDKVEYLDYKEYEDQPLAENDYTNAKKDLETDQWAVYINRGNSRPVVDPDDETNMVLASITGYSGYGLMYPGDPYTANSPSTYVKVTRGTTYKVSFDWKYKGFQSGGSTEIRVGLSKNCETDAAEGGGRYVADAPSKLVREVAAGEYNDTTWNRETCYFTVDESWDIETYPNLVLYTWNGGTAGIAYFDNIEVSIPAAATVEYNYGNMSHSEYYADGDIKDYQPLESEGITVTWYTDEACTKAYDFADYTEYKEVTLYAKGSYQAGDVDGDGTVAETDVTALRDVLAGAKAKDTTSNAAKANAVVNYDVNGDDAEDVKDLVHAAKLVRLPDGIGITSVTLSLYQEENENDTYQYGVAWQSTVQLQTPVVEVIPADGTWENVAAIKRIIGSAEDSTAHSTYKLKDNYDYTTIGSTAGGGYGSGWYLNDGLITTHSVATVYANKLVISGLTAGQTYKYRVGDAALKEYSAEGTFTAYSSKENGANDTSFNFIFMTDSQQTSDRESSKVVWGRTLWTAMNNMPSAEFLALGGDLVNYNSIEQQWTELLDANKKYMMSIPTMPTAGNHEWNMVSGGSINSAYDFNSHFNLSYQKSAEATADTLKNGYSGTYYSYDYKGVHFVVLNTNEVYTNHTANGTYTLGEEQMAWLENDLTKAKTAEDAGTIKYTIVYMHHGLYTVGAAGIGSDSHETKDLRTQLQGIFAENGVDLVLNGHDHIYSVTKVLDKDGNIVTGTDTTGGVVYMTGAIAGTTSPSKSNFDISDGNGGTYNGVGTNTADKYAKIISHEELTYPDTKTKIALSNCWTELCVDEEGITITTYTVNKQEALQLDTFTIKPNNIGTTFDAVSE